MILLYTFIIFSFLIGKEPKNHTKEGYFKHFIDNNFSNLISGQDLIQMMRKIDLLNKKYQQRLSTNFNDFYFSEQEAAFFKNLMTDYFKEEFLSEKDKKLPIRQLKDFKASYQRVLCILLKDEHEKLPSSRGNDNLVFYFFDEDASIIENRGEYFFSDIHSSPLYFSWVVNGLNKGNKVFDPYIFGGDLSDRSLLPHLDKTKLAVAFDLFLNQVHLLNNLYVHYCLKNNKLENIFMLSTLGNHEELSINRNNDKRIYHSFWNDFLERYSDWTVFMFKKLIPLEIKFLSFANDGVNVARLTSCSHAVGKELYDMKKVYEGDRFKVMKATSGACPSSMFHGNKNYQNYLNLLGEYHKYDTKPALWTDPFYGDRSLTVYYKRGRGFQIGNLAQSIDIFKKIETENIRKNDILKRSMLSDYTYHSCCGHQHAENTLRDGFVVDFKIGKIFFSSYYEDVNAHDRVYFSMCATCMNLYYMQFKRYLQLLNIKYPELLCFLELDFFIDGGFKNRDELKKNNFILNGNTFINHEEILAFLERQKNEKHPYLNKAKSLFYNKHTSDLSKADRLLYEKMKQFFDKI